MAELTPLMAQYESNKAEHQNAVLFFRLGDFYEMFREDAIEVSTLLNLTLTKRNGVPMCGIPYHAAHAYIPRLLKLGKKIAICEQTTPPGGKGIIERKVIEVITPGTVLEEDYLDRGKNNFLVAISHPGEEWLSWVMVDLSTGDFRATRIKADGGLSLRRELARVQTQEILVQSSLWESPDYRDVLQSLSGVSISPSFDWEFNQEKAYRTLTELFGTASLKGFGLEPESLEINAAGVLVKYLESSAQRLLIHLKGITVYHEDDFVGIDESSQRNLELTQNLQDSSRFFTLLEVLDRTKTGMGARYLRERLLRPLKNKDLIERGLSDVTILTERPAELEALREELGRVMDLQRLSSRLALDRAHARDLLGIRNSIEHAQNSIGILRRLDFPVDGISAADEEDLRGVAETISRTIMEEPSILLTEGRLIKPGFSEELDALRDIKRDSHAVLEAYLAEERGKTGIPGLKIKHNNIIGYFIELSKSQLSGIAQAPSWFIRKQSLVNGERFTTERLLELEEKIDTAEEKTVDLERRIFLELRESLKAHIALFSRLSAFIATVDYAQSLALVAREGRWVRPEIREGLAIEIVNGRHPVVEDHVAAGEFIPNDLRLGAAKDGRFALITGPNMAGKSTYLRQNALIVLLAQIGSYVPADSAHIGLVDKIFCRVGAQDNVARGESTFLVEMNETAFILNTATEKSLVIMDEVGRGTSTTDGLSLAWAISEYILERIKARTLFATHYHELAELKHPNLVDLTLEVLENDGEIVFAKKVRPGVARSSYGLHVARLAGIPAEALARARQIQEELLRHESISGGEGKIASAPKPAPRQASFFNDSELIIQEIKSMRLNDVTPLEALNKIAMWNKVLKIKNDS